MLLLLLLPLLLILLLLLLLFRLLLLLLPSKTSPKKDLARRLSAADRSLADLAARPNDEAEPG